LWLTLITWQSQRLRQVVRYLLLVLAAGPGALGTWRVRRLLT
jgi:hypothetical protein